MPDAVDLFAQLTSSQRALLPFFRHAVATDMTPTQILSSLRTEGYGIRTQTGLDIVGALRGELNNARRVRLQGDDIVLNPDEFGKGSTNMRRSYTHEVLVRSHDAATGEVGNVYVNVSTNDLLTAGQIKDIARGYVGNRGCNAMDTIDSVELQQSFRSSTLG